MRDPRRLALIALVALVIAGVALFRIEVIQEYSAAPGVVVSWGQGEGQIPTAASRDGLLFGVRCFCVDRDGGIYMADWERGRVLKFDRDLELVSVTELGRRRASIDDMAFLRGGTMLVVDNSRPEILAIPAEGAPSVVWNGRLPGPAVHLVESVSAGDGGTVYVSSSVLTKSEYIKRLSAVSLRGGEKTVAEVAMGPSGEVRSTGFEGEAPRYPISLCVSGRGGFYVSPESCGPAANVIRRYGWDGKPAGEYALKVEGQVRHVTIIGEDRAGLLYTGVDLGTPSGEVLVFDRRGALSGRIPAPYAGKTRSSVYARVDAGGAVYLLEAGEHEAVVRRMVPRRRMSVVRR